MLPSVFSYLTPAAAVHCLYYICLSAPASLLLTFPNHAITAFEDDIEILFQRAEDI